MNGSHVYSTPSGGEVEVTSVGSQADFDRYQWSDKRDVGQVLHWIRDGEQGELMLRCAENSRMASGRARIAQDESEGIWR